MPAELAPDMPATLRDPGYRMLPHLASPATVFKFLFQPPAGPRRRGQEAARPAAGPGGQLWRGGHGRKRQPLCGEVLRTGGELGGVSELFGLGLCVCYTLAVGAGLPWGSEAHMVAVGAV